VQSLWGCEPRIHLESVRLDLEHVFNPHTGSTSKPTSRQHFTRKSGQQYLERRHGDVYGHGKQGNWAPDLGHWVGQGVGPAFWHGFWGAVLQIGAFHQHVPAHLAILPVNEVETTYLGLGYSSSACRDSIVLERGAGVGIVKIARNMGVPRESRAPQLCPVAQSIPEMDVCA